MTRIIGLTILAVTMAVSLGAQVRFQLELLSNDAIYRVSMVPEVTWVFPQNLTASSQVTIRVPHAPIPYGFVVGNLQSLQPGTEWDDNVRVYAPIEAPEWDYISFSLISGATSAFNYTAGTAVPLFEFENDAVSCLGEVEIIDIENDPFLPPNSLGANIAHSITTIGGGLTNACWGIVGDAAVPCLPIPNCTVMGDDIEVSICENEVYQGQVFMQDTVLVNHYFGFQGCDSIVETPITVIGSSYGNIDLTRCKGSVFQGVLLSADTLIEIALQSSAGCDSILTANIHVVDHYSTQQNMQLCQGGNYEGIPILNDTILVQNWVAEAGCDSIVTMFIQVVEQLESQFDTAVCAGTLFNGIPINTDTTLVETFFSTTGCDSIVYWAVMVNDLPKPSIELQQNECFSTLYCNGFAAYSWNTGETSSSIGIATAGSYHITVTDGFGCTGTAGFDFQGITNLLAEAIAMQPDCGANRLGSIQFEAVSGGVAPYRYSINSGLDFSTAPSFDNLEGGLYQAVVEDAAGCRWADNVQISPPPFISVNGDEYAEIALGENVVLDVVSNFEYDSIKWVPDFGLECPICSKTTASPLETTTYQVVFFGKNGCELSMELTVAVDERELVYIPNAFSPNGDGINDLFFLFADKTVVTIKQLLVFDRYGGLVFSVMDAIPNDPQYGWDGELDGKTMGNGIYTYKAELVKINGAVEYYGGSINLLK